MTRTFILAAALVASGTAAASPERYRVDVADGHRKAILALERGPVETRWMLACFDEGPGHPARWVIRKGVATAEPEWVMGEHPEGRFTLATRPTAPLFMATAGLDGCPRAGVPTVRRLP
ncbi:hypothetical protein FV226_07620 [Methylobacterium sp. WL12]|uniref:hypothetical protein n=1 Tax=Methylobacterium sp. WL12 TaxID=2603890 RepID=UPI0011C7F108|nr:hypothetical protein [Methylobacterium sp. WL12]TXM74136.1 hypothetical protein FV226_07620 [Methylobacterium sp. WL12]